MKDPIRVTTLTRWARSIRRWFSRDEWFVWWLGLPRSRQAPTSSGIVVIQLQGVGLQEMQSALDRARLPMIERLLQREDYRLQPLAWGLHADSAAGQTRLFYGSASESVQPPPWQRRSHDGFEPDDLRTWEQELAQLQPGLLKGGSVYNSYLLGEAAEAHHCATSPGWSDQWAARGPHRILLALLFYVWILVRLILGTAAASLGILRDQLLGRRPRPRWRDLPRRMLVSILLRELATLGVCADCARGVPIIYANLHGGEQSPGMLSKLDQSLGRIWRAAHRGAGREYDLWVVTSQGSLTTAHQSSAKTSQVVQAIEDWASHQRTSLAERPQDDQQTRTRGSWLEIDWLSRLWLRYAHHPRQLELPPLEVWADNGVIRIGGVATLPDDQQSELRQALLAAMETGCLVSGAPDAPRWWFVDCAPAEADSLNPDQRWPAWWSTWIQEQVRQALQSKPTADWLVLVGPSQRKGVSHEPVAPASGALLVPSDIAAHRPDQPWTVEELRTSLIRFRRRPVGNGQPIQPRRHGQVRVMTYNIHAAVGMDGELSCDRIARVISQADADVVCLQEVDVGRARSQHVDQAAEIAKQLQMQYCFFPARTQGDEQFGNAILSRFPFQSARLDQLYQEKPSRSGRSAMWLTIELPDERRLHVINTHLSIYPREQSLQARELAEHWASQATAQGPTILCGDFNAGPQSATCRTLREVLDDVEDQPGAGASTYFSPFPVARVDHLLVSPGLPVAQAQVVSSRLARSASDHLPLYCDLVLPPT